MSFKDSNVGRFQFLNIFHNHNFEKSLGKAVEAFKVWASRGIPAGWKFSKCVFGSNMSVKHLKMVRKNNEMQQRGRDEREKDEGTRRGRERKLKEGMKVENKKEEDRRKANIMER